MEHITSLFQKGSHFPNLWDFTVCSVISFQSMELVDCCTNCLVILFDSVVILFYFSYI